MRIYENNLICFEMGILYAKGLLDNRAKHFRKYELFMGGGDEELAAWEAASQCCEYISGILDAETKDKVGLRYALKAILGNPTRSGEE